MSDTSQQGTVTPPQGLFELATVTINTRSFTFQAVPWTGYHLLADGNFKIDGAFQAPYGPQVTINTLHRVAITLADGTTIVVDEKGLTRIVTPTGYEWDIWHVQPIGDYLGGQPYLNMYALALPASFSSATGVLPQSTGNDAASYSFTT